MNYEFLFLIFAFTLTLIALSIAIIGIIAIVYRQPESAGRAIDALSEISQGIMRRLPWSGKRKEQITRQE